jgi:hypothetical protein
VGVSPLVQAGWVSHFGNLKCARIHAMKTGDFLGGHVPLDGIPEMAVSSLSENCGTRRGATTNLVAKAQQLSLPFYEETAVFPRNSRKTTGRH